MTPADLRASIRAGTDDRPVAPGRRGLLINALEQALGGAENRHLVLAYLTGHVHIAEVPTRMLNALLAHVKPEYTDKQVLIGAEFWREAAALLAVAQIEARKRELAAGQMELRL